LIYATVSDRTVTIAGVDQLRARFNANAFSGRVEGGYRFVTAWMGLTPYAAGQSRRSICRPIPSRRCPAQTGI
jgi:uncharacterized protein with beta-barrel porin domain